MHIVPIQGWDVKASAFLHTTPDSARINFTVRVVCEPALHAAVEKRPGCGCMQGQDKCPHKQLM
jgi:hypothetical protein